MYNPIARPLSSWVRIPVAGKAYTVTGPDSKSLVTQVNNPDLYVGNDCVNSKEYNINTQLQQLVYAWHIFLIKAILKFHLV